MKNEEIFPEIKKFRQVTYATFNLRTYNTWTRNIIFSGGNFLNCCNKTLSAREVARFLCKRVIANEGFDNIEIEGKLVCVGRDFIAIKTDDRQVFYLPLNNVRNLSVVSDKSCCDNDRKRVCNDTFQSILRKLINCRVQVNDGGDDVIEGLLTSVNRRSIQIVEEENLNLVTIPIGSINFIAQTGDNGDESSNCKILCCKKENPCGKRKHDCKKESSSSFCKKDKCCKKESSSKCCKKDHCCKKESSSKCCKKDHCCKKEDSCKKKKHDCKKESSSSSSSSSFRKEESSSNNNWCIDWFKM
ncbi:hypothetical protein [Fictibacillus barbaricus]|uniref:Spore coat protein B n=1 Tax=Fictibacillus barbaricus TaxID=182136 RepID=A0ABU1U0M4_9BACL|nr:hypothetical protein [Fictibacillus barbaricus]MDR7073010.1 hypothetical protein [Fictibacillus barbaricus]